MSTVKSWHIFFVKEIDECNEYAKSFCSQTCIDEPGKPFKCGCHENYYLAENYKDCKYNTSITTTVSDKQLHHKF